MASLRRLTEHFRGRGETQGGSKGLGRVASLMLGGVIAVAAGTVLVKAGSDPQIREVFLEFNKPIRRAVEPYIQQVRMPQVFRRNEPRQAQTLNSAPPRYLPSSRPETVERSVGLPRGALDIRPVEGLQPLPAPRAAKVNRSLTSPEPGLATATNYCVRLCDGFAFPVGRAGMGDEGAQEAACRLACPNSQVALFTMPKGAKDFSEATRGGVNYSALPTAFNYRESYNASCTCRPKGQTQSASALLGDFTLRRGDLAMTRIGVRHFDGSGRFPHRSANFSDALGKLRDPKEIRRVKEMEAASLRGNLPVEAHAAVRNRVASEIRLAEMKAGNAKVVELEKPSRRFQELQAKRFYGPQLVRVIERRQGLIAMN
ncbi:MAG: DUF2865 domain-containing protein [Rhizobiales bacterium]|nr:DUF2865 domain-containing protein [Hyphomicrobiales bacterium]